MKEYDVVLASGAEHLRRRFEELGFRVYTSALNYDGRRMFPNADIYVRIDGVERLSDRKVIVIQTCTGSGPADIERYTTSDRVIELMLILDLLKRPVNVEEVEHKKFCCTPITPPSRVEVVLTFQPYALQDKEFITGEASSGRWALETLSTMCDKVWLVNPHAPQSLDWVQEKVKAGTLEYIDVAPDLIKHAAKQFGFNKYVVITPDEGGQERFSVEGFGKNRTSSYKVELFGDLDVEGKNVIVIDDLTKSGSTLLKARKKLKDLGAKDVGLAVVHVIPLRHRGEILLERLVAKSDRKIATTNTVNTEVFCEEYPELTCNIVDSLIEYLG